MAQVLTIFTFFPVLHCSSQAQFNVNLLQPMSELMILKQQERNYQGNKCLAWGNFVSLLEEENPGHLKI